MTDAERDPVVRRAIDELQRMPPADAAAIRRVVAAAAAARVTPADDEPLLVAPRRTFRVWTVAAIAAVAAFVGFALSNARRPEAVAPPSMAASRLPAGGLQPVANSPADARPIASQFVFHSRAARSVSVVGDFNRWTPGATRMTRGADGEFWSATILILPGRHIYGFMVNDSVFTLDPNAAKARDADLGTDGSVIIVGKP